VREEDKLRVLRKICGSKRHEGSGEEYVTKSFVTCILKRYYGNQTNHEIGRARRKYGGQARWM
jgi:hypothetical protein